MSNNIYDILGKLNGLKPKDNPVSMSAEPVYESIDPQDITPAVDSLEEKYQNFLAEETAKRSQQKDAEISRGEPEIVKLLNKARLERPSAASDTEALAYQMVKANKELEKANAANDEQETKIADLQAKISVSPTAKSAPAAQPTPAPAPVAVAQPTAAAPTTAPAARPSATILRMPTPATAEVPTQAEVPATAEVPAQAPATDEVPAQAKPARTYKSAGAKKSAVGGKVAPILDQPTPDELAKTQKPVRAPNIYDFPTLQKTSTVQKTPLKKAVGQQFNNENKSMKDMLKESIELVKEYREGDPDMGLLNYNTLLEKFKTGVQKINLNFGPGKDLTLYDYQAYGLLSELGSDQNEERKVARIEGIMSSYDAVVNLLQTPKVKRYIGLFPQFEKTSPIFKQRASEIEKGKFKLSAPDPKKGFQDPNYNPKTDPNSSEYDPKYPVHPYQQGDGQLEENVGNDTMQENVKTNSILEGVRQVEIKKLKEAAKPDFLDLDKDGDTDEPMKSAAKSAKKHEPADIDKDAVAKRKRLQALKDKQEDERAEKGDDDKSASRFVKGRAYGGSAQKDDKENDDLDEGSMKHAMHKDAENMSLEQFCDKYGEVDWVKEFYNDINKPLDEQAQTGNENGIFVGYSDFMDAEIPSVTSFLDKQGVKHSLDQGKDAHGLEYTNLVVFNIDDKLKKRIDDYLNKRTEKYNAENTGFDGYLGYEPESDQMAESGLQAYLGKKKYGKEGMKALQQAGRDGASKEKMALIRAKHDKMDEVAPPGAKAERMVKHIKKGYSKDGNLSKKEKGIAYATAWKARNKGQVEEATNFGDTIKNSEGKMTKVKVTEGKDAIRNHPIYTNEQAWNHYSQELAEQEAMGMEQSMMEAPVDVQQELDEIAKLAGLAPKMEAKSVCPSCKCEKCECNENLDPMVPSDSASPLTHTLEGMGCTMEELQEAMSRKDYRTMANKIKNMDDRDLAGEMCEKFAEMAKADNPRFKEDMFFAACDIKNPASVLVDEETMDEGNEFTKARLDAIAQGKDTFSVSGKTYNVSGDTSDEKTQVESVNEDINVNITANGEQDALNLLRKLSGMAEVPQVTSIAIPMGDESSTCETCGSSPCGCEESVEEERDIELANTPHETVAPINAVTVDAGGGLGGVKKQYPLAANRGANPLEEEKLWSAYESMINDVKA